MPIASGRTFWNCLGRDGREWQGNVGILLYKDDAQIQALSVICRHGEDHPMIHVSCRPLSTLLDDLELAAEAMRVSEMDDFKKVYQKEQEQEWIEQLRKLKSEEQRSRDRLGERGV